MNSLYFRNAIYAFFTFLIVSCSSESKKNTINKNTINAEIINAFEITKNNIEDRILVIEILDFIEYYEVKIDDPFTKGRLMYLKAASLLIKYDISKAKEIINKTITLAIKNNDKVLHANALQISGVIVSRSKNTNDKNSRFRYYEEALIIFIEINDYNQIIDSHYNLARSYQKIENWEKSKYHVNKAIELINSLAIKQSRLKYLYAFLALNNVNLNLLNEVEDNLTKAENMSSEKAIRCLALINFTRARYLEVREKFYESNLYYSKSIDYNDKTLLHQLNEIYKNNEDELTLKTKLIARKEETHNIQNLILASIILFLIVSILLILPYIKMVKKLKISYSKIKSLNNQLKESLQLLKKDKMKLKDEDNQIENLLEINEKIILSKIMKITIYNETITQIINKTNELKQKHETIKPNHLFILEKTLKTLIDSDGLWEDFKKHFDKTRPNFFKKLTHLSNLTINDLKHCAYIITQLTIKDVANLINVSPRSVETTRYRIKKKLNLDKETSLFNFLQKL